MQGENFRFKQKLLEKNPLQEEKYPALYTSDVPFVPIHHIFRKILELQDVFRYVTFSMTEDVPFLKRTRLGRGD